MIRDAKATFGVSQEHDAAIRGEPPTVKRGGDFLAGNVWTGTAGPYRRTWRVWLGVIVLMDGFDTQSVNTISSLHDTRHRISAMTLSKTG